MTPMWPMAPVVPIGGWGYSAYRAYKAVGAIGFIASYISMLFDLLPRIGLQLTFIIAASFYAYRYIAREIKRTRSAENDGGGGIPHPFKWGG